MKFALKAPGGKALTIIYALLSIAVIVTIPLLYSDLYERVLYRVFTDAFVSADVVAISPSYVSGLIKKIYVKRGDAVKKGQMIVLIDDTMYKADLDRSLSKLKAIEGRLKRISKNPDEKAEVMELKDELDVMQQDVKIAKLMLSYTRIVSPINGIVAQVMLKSGDVVTPGEVILYLYRPSTLYVKLYVTPEEAVDFRRGMKVIVKTADGSIKGRVDYIGGVEVFKVCNIGNPRVPVRISVKDKSKLRFGEPVRVVAE